MLPRAKYPGHIDISVLGFQTVACYWSRAQPSVLSSYSSTRYAYTHACRNCDYACACACALDRNYKYPWEVNKSWCLSLRHGESQKWSLPLAVEKQQKRSFFEDDSRQCNCQRSDRLLQQRNEQDRIRIRHRLGMLVLPPRLSATVFRASRAERHPYGRWGLLLHPNHE